MKTKKLDLLDFKQNELSREDISSVMAGAPLNGKPQAPSSGNGAGTGGHCYYDFETGSVICEPVEPNEDTIPTSDI